MAAQDSDSEEEDFVTYGKPLEPLEQDEPAKKPIPLQDQTVKDEKGRYQRFHGAFTGGFSAGYYNTVGSKEGWTPSTFVSSRQEKAERPALKNPEDFMDAEDLGEHGIAPTEIMTTDDFASKAKDKIQEKARQLSSLTAPIPGASILQDLIASAKISIGIQLLRKMGWKEGQGVGPRTKRKPRRQKTGLNVKVYGCSLPREGSAGSEDEEDEYQPENVTFAPKDVIPIDFTLKDNVQGLGYKGIDPLRAFFGASQESPQMLTDRSEKTSSLLGDVRQSKGRMLGITGQAFGVGALEEDDDDIYGTDFLSKYDTVLNDEEPGESLFGWTAPKEYKKQKASQKEFRYVGKILDGFSLASVSTASKQIYLPPDLPKDFRPVHYFRPVLAADKENSQVLQVMLKPTDKPQSDIPQQSRHQLSSSQRREILGETSLQGSSSVLELLSEKDRERILEVKQTVELQKAKAKELALLSLQSRFQSASTEKAQNNSQPSMFGLSSSAAPSDFQPFVKNPEKQQRYAEYIRKLKDGHKDALESCSDFTMTEWERRREQDEFMRAAVLYKSSGSTLSCRFTRAKYEDDTETVEVPRDAENDATDKEAAAKMKMFGKLTRDKFEWHPAKLLCKRFNIPDPFPGSTIIGLPTVKRDKYSVFNFLTVPETPSSKEINSEREPQLSNADKTKKQSRWDLSAEEKKNDSLSEFLSSARSEIDVKQKAGPLAEKEGKSGTSEQSSLRADKEDIKEKQEEEAEESRPSTDLFKAIFASSSDEKSSSSSDEDSEEEELPVEMPDAKTLKEPLPEVKDLRVATKEPVLLVVPPSMQNRESDSDNEFGPKLPPISSSDASRMPAEVHVVTSTQTLQKQKRKKNKEKHKTKKDHKHKKEKKKKNKKHKHKSKQKSKKTETKSSSDSSESSDESGPEVPTDISTSELLKRLKRLSDPR